MEKLNVKAKKWGNSLGIIIPSDIVRSQNIDEKSELEVLINIKNRTKAGDIFGIFKEKLKRNTENLLNEVDKDFEK